MDDRSDAPRINASFYSSMTGDLSGATGRVTDFFRDFMAINNPNIVINNSSVGRDGVELLPPIVGQINYKLDLRAPNLDLKEQTKRHEEDEAAIEAALFDPDFSFER